MFKPCKTRKVYIKNDFQVNFELYFLSLYCTQLLCCTLIFDEKSAATICTLKLMTKDCELPFNIHSHAFIDNSLPIPFVSQNGKDLRKKTLKLHLN